MKYFYYSRKIGFLNQVTVSALFSIDRRFLLTVLFNVVYNVNILIVSVFSFKYMHYQF